MPVVIEPETRDDRELDALLVYCAEQRDRMNRSLWDCGAILFRGFDITSVGGFHRFAEAQGGALQNYVGGDSPRSEVEDKIYTSTDFASNLEIYLHNELSYAGWHPSRVFFFCATPPGGGGQTTIGDSRKIYKSMRPALAERFAEKGVAYIQNLHRGTGPGKSWQETYETDDPAVAEAHCRQHGVEYEWTEYGLWTRIVRKGVIDHPVTGQRAWFNQADQFHAMAPSARVDPKVSREWGDGQYPCHATFGDGIEITLDELAEIRQVFEGQEVLFPWARGDVLMLDNLIAAHGRKPYEGERQILVAMS